MTETTKARVQDRLLSSRIAILMRWGTLVASGLLSAGVGLDWIGQPRASAVLVVAGCVTLILLPVLRLAVMLGTYKRNRDHPYVAITVLVMFLIAGSAVTGWLL